MSETKKQRTVREKVAAESAYARAAARWVASKSGDNVERIYEVTFYRVDDEVNENGTWWPGELGVAYLYNGRRKTIQFEEGMSTGQFLEECVALLEREAL